MLFAKVIACVIGSLMGEMLLLMFGHCGVLAIVAGLCVRVP